MMEGETEDVAMEGESEDVAMEGGTEMGKIRKTDVFKSSSEERC